MRNLFLYPVEALNAIRSNVWSVILIAAGIALVHLGHNQEGMGLVTGAFAIFRSQSSTEQDSPKQDSTPNNEANHV